MVSRTHKGFLALCGLVIVGVVVVSLAPFSAQEVNCDGPVFMAFSKVQVPKPGGGLQAVDGIRGHDARTRLVFAGALGSVAIVAGITAWVAHHRRA